MKKIKMIIAISLCITVLYNSTVFATDMNMPMNSESDIYADRLTEMVKIEDVTYTYTYFYDKNGNRTIHIKNDANDFVDVVKYCEESSTIYLNGKAISEPLDEDIIDNAVSSRAANYTYVGSKTKRISWGSATTAAAVAAAIAVAVGSIGGAAVIAAMGIGALSTLAGASGGGTVRTKIYELKAGKVTNYKYVWSFTASTGSKYGDYTSYITV